MFQQTLLESWFEADPIVFAPLSRHAGAILHLEMRPFFTGYWQIEPNGRIIPSCIMDSPTLSLKGSLADYLRYTWTQNTARVTLQGDLGLAHTLQQVFRQFDWTFSANRLLGPTLGSFLLKGVQKLHRHGQQRTTNFIQDLKEYWESEARLIASRPMVEVFCSDVDRLRDQAERLQARITRLEKHSEG